MYAIHHSQLASACYTSLTASLSILYITHSQPQYTINHSQLASVCYTSLTASLSILYITHSQPQYAIHHSQLGLTITHFQIGQIYHRSLIAFPSILYITFNVFGNPCNILFPPYFVTFHDYTHTKVFFVVFVVLKRICYLICICTM